ncbi:MULTISPECIES: DEAD/DEAH box helicase [unclassified Leptolyngbya]|uniref:DEAD/DEAH box helicase n=1 Tax=unclassified Leptolyngbya TaxID=2650499 RepID=UPI001688F66F|nr:MULTISPECIES: DEAD/DEAH box helicase [unclassified Leptolyngbya]MBD1909631.1 DEAD/DEAH box helicase [Leptolyngbya sp. FACHB-8]MBD2154169.1 DEAD/DEAH box helicase [Leptolyngbya sp. FACHB-16]
MTFSNLGLSDGIVRAVTARGYTEPTPIQAQAIPAILSGRDVLAGAQTGTGKTAGFTLPILQRLSTQPVSNLGHRRPPIRTLILTPTRELAAQVEESVKAYGVHLGLKSITVFGGVNMNPQVRQLKGRVDILVATPGRLLDHVQQGTVDLSQVEILVLDEADRMLDMGFIRDIRRVLNLLPKQRQNLLFSATFSPEIKSLAQSLLHEPVLIEVPPVHPKAELITQKVYRVASDRKSDLLTHLIKQNNWYQVLVFTRTKHGADRLSKKLAQAGITSLAIHGNKSQAARTRSLAQFKGGNVQVLVATDIAARGIDITELPMVINYELPNVPEDYVHRIGRTGRAGSEGEALSLVCADEYKYLSDIEKLMKRSVPQEVVEGFEPDSSAVAANLGRQSGHAGRQGRSQPNQSSSHKPKLRSQDSSPRKSARSGQAHAKPVPSSRSVSERRKAH